MPSKKTIPHGLTLILDAYNVIHAIPELERRLEGKLEDARKALISYCREYQEVQGNIAQVILVFDGKKNAGFWNQDPIFREGAIEIIFSEDGQTADDKIIEFLETVSAPEKFAVVSNDNYVANNARAHGVRVFSVQNFSGAVKRKRTANPDAGTGAVQAQRITEEYRQYLGIKD